MNRGDTRVRGHAIELRGLAHPLPTAMAAAATGVVAAFVPREFAYVIAALAAAAGLMVVLLRWRSALMAALAYLPLAGVVILALSPSKLPLLFKDLLFLAPAYVLFAHALISGRESLRGFPRAPVGLMCALAVLVVVQMLNPGVPSPMVALIGLKVWLFYIPLIFLGYAMCSDERDLVVLLRLLVALTVIPCVVGITELMLTLSMGYQFAMESIYGGAAGDVTQQFAQFDVGEVGLLVRIPSTFTFVTQYFGFTLAMIVPAYSLMHLDASARWRTFALGVLALDVIACLTCGVRSAFVYLPLMMALIVLLDRSPGAVTLALAPAVALAVGAVMLLGVDFSVLYYMVWGLTGHYATELAYGALASSISQWPLGEGTGVNTGAARYAFADMESFIAIENYYAKAVHELGVAGLLVVAGLFASLIAAGSRVRSTLRDTGLHSFAAALLAFIITMSITSLKGWQLDLDPINVYFWVFAGAMLKLPALENVRGGRSHRASTALPSCAESPEL